MQSLVRVALVALAGAVLTSAAVADTLYTTQAAFAAATSNPTTLDLSPYEPNAGPGYDLTYYYSPLTIAASDPVTVTAPSGPNSEDFAVVASDSYCCQMGVDSLYSIPSLTLTFQDPINALSWSAANGYAAPGVFVYLAEYCCSVLVAIGADTNYLNFPGGNGFVPAFGGITTTTPFTVITFIPVGNPDGDEIELGNITYAEANTPEPSSLFLLGTGLTGFLGIIRRKLKKDNRCGTAHSGPKPGF